MNAYTVARPERLFPLVRHLSRHLTPWLARTALTPNAITLLSVGLGLGAAACFATGDHAWSAAGALALVASYVMDNSDGEVARLKSLSSDFGRFLDTFGGWLVHALLFVCLGAGMAKASGAPGWFWLGVIAAAGGTIDFLVQEARARAPGAAQAVAPETWKERVVYVFHELTRADFCFIVLALALADALWALLPAAAIGAHVYWVSYLAVGPRTFHA